MNDKIKNLFTSIRFWMLTAGAVFQILAFYLPQLAELWNILTVWLAAVVAIGSADSVARNIGTGTPTKETKD